MTVRRNIQRLQGVNPPCDNFTLHANYEHDGKETQKPAPHQGEGDQEVRVDGRAICPNDARRLVQRVLPFDRKLDDGKIDGAHQRQDGGCFGGSTVVIECLPKTHIAQIQEEHDENGR